MSIAQPAGLNLVDPQSKSKQGVSVADLLEKACQTGFFKGDRSNLKHEAGSSMTLFGSSNMAKASSSAPRNAHTDSALPSAPQQDSLVSNSGVSTREVTVVNPTVSDEWLSSVDISSMGNNGSIYEVERSPWIDPRFTSFPVYDEIDLYTQFHPGLNDTLLNPMQGDQFDSYNLSGIDIDPFPWMPNNGELQQFEVQQDD